jgi:hypothetical protein
VLLHPNNFLTLLNVIELGELFRIPNNLVGAMNHNSYAPFSSQCF